MKLKLITTVVGFLAFSLPTFPQSAKPSVGAGPPSHPVAPANPNTILNRDFNNMTKTGRKGDYLTGSVALEGGSLPWDSIPVTVTCDGQIRYTTATDPKRLLAIANRNIRDTPKYRNDYSASRGGLTTPRLDSCPKRRFGRRSRALAQLSNLLPTRT
jgi:hypothetical protein